MNGWTVQNDLYPLIPLLEHVLCHTTPIRPLQMGYYLHPRTNSGMSSGDVTRNTKYREEENVCAETKS